jgi:hypothetical protein
VKDRTETRRLHRPEGMPIKAMAAWGAFRAVDSPRSVRKAVGSIRGVADLSAAARGAGAAGDRDRGANGWGQGAPRQRVRELRPKDRCQTRPCERVTGRGSWRRTGVRRGTHRLPGLPRHRGGPVVAPGLEAQGAVERANGDLGRSFERQPTSSSSPRGVHRIVWPRTGRG